MSTTYYTQDKLEQMACGMVDDIKATRNQTKNWSQPEARFVSWQIIVGNGNTALEVTYSLGRKNKPVTHHSVTCAL